jgi:hypothetical protein
MLRFLFVKTSHLLSTKKTNEIQIILTSALKSNLMLFICGLMPGIILFKVILGCLFFNKLTPEKIDVMYTIFLCLIPFYMILSVELPFTNITIAMKKGINILKINLVSLTIFTAILLLGMKNLKIFIIPSAMFCAQLYNTLIYIKLVNSKIHFFNKNWTKIFTEFGALGSLIVSINLFLKNYSLIQFYLNILIISLWIYFSKKDLIIIFQTMVKKGEIK